MKWRILSAKMDDRKISRSLTNPFLIHEVPLTAPDQKSFCRVKSTKIRFRAGMFFAVLFLFTACQRHPEPNSVTEISPDSDSKCYIVTLDGQVFHTKASVYHNTSGERWGKDLFIFNSSDIGTIEFRKKNGIWKAWPEDLIRQKEDTPVKIHWITTDENNCQLIINK